MRIIKTLMPFLISLAFVLVACDSPNGYTQESVPDLIMVERENFFPEGIEYDTANRRFLLSSVSEGTIFAVKDDGTYQAFIEDDDLISTLGIEIDLERNRLLVANSNPAVYTDRTLKSQVFLGIYNLTTGERLHMIGLIEGEPKGGHIANDIAVDTEGNAYVTDTAAFAVHKVDINGNASVFVESDQFGSPNGIIYHPGGYLLVADAGNGSIFKVPLDNPEGIARVELEQVIEGADGMVLHPNNNLIVVGSRIQTIFSLSSDDDWASATIEATVANHPASTIALRGDQVYAIYPHLDKYFSGETVKVFEIVRVKCW
ncbi:SMP-30/gluconolactonase/LRE family protein [Patescibacteria group bacterium]|nr:SMP-30/gluconolactonase/LRE family protein [Patescibacteria group bacterium]